MKELNNDLIRKTVKTALSHLGVSNVKVDVIELGKEEIRQANVHYRGFDKVTDVLSFPLLKLKAGEIPTAEKFPRDVNPETGELQIGDVLICTEVAAEQAQEYGHSFQREFAFLIVHGLLHILGYDHKTSKNESIMMRVTEEIMAKLGLARE